MPFGIRRAGLRTKIIAWTFFPTMIILIAVAFFIYGSYERVTEDLVIEQNRDVAHLVSLQIEADLEEYVNVIFYETYTLGIIGNDPDIQRDTLKGAANRLAVFDAGTMILNTFGTVVATEPERPEIIGEDWSDRAYYRQVLRLNMKNSPEAVFSDIVEDGKDGAEVLCIAVPIVGEHGEFLGCMVGMFHMGATAASTFYGDLVKLNLGKSGNAYLVDSNGRVIYHTDSDRISNDFSTGNIVQRVLGGQSDAIRTDDIEGNEIVASYAPVSGTSWGLVIETSWSSLINSSKGDRHILLLLLSLGVVIPIIIVAFGVRKITRPIALVSKAAREIAAGNFHQKIIIDTGDELEEMAKQFNAMAGALEESYATLEQKVEDRTRGERRRAEQLRAVNEVGRKISSILDLDELLPFVAKSLQSTFKYYNVSIILTDQGSGELILKASAGAYEGRGDIGTVSKEASGIANSVAQSGEPLMVNDVPSNPIYYCFDGLGDTQAELAVPIKVGGRTIGVLDIEESRVDAFDELDLFTAQTLADQLAIAIENARLYEHAQELATVEERQRLARDLHDAVTQTLFSASLIAEVLPRLWEKNPDEGRKRLEELRRSTRGALAEMRMLLLELRPAALTEANLGELLRQMIDAAIGKSGANITLTMEGQGVLPADVQIAFYRVAQEALNNIQKHASASEVSIALRYQPEPVTLTISDDGIGFDPDSVSSEHLGLGIMCERADAIGAECKIESETGQGTRITVSWQDSLGEEQQ